MAITRQDVEKVALLGRLQLSEAELATMSEQLAQIVGYVDHLAEVEHRRRRADGPRDRATERVPRRSWWTASLPREEALANAPHHDARGYLVPAVLGE